MAESSGKPPPLVGSWRIRYLAACFNSTDGTVKGVANKFDRARLRARIRFEKRMAGHWYRRHYFAHGSPDGSFANLPPESRDAALLKAHHGLADLESYHREAMKRPMLLRGDMHSFLHPFREPYYD
ncbi:hypothetical protein IVB30_00205 [Bradyrhizobium sp. 200]|uniref:hypothetical protein n=1 Tax=Bradyrhizobium sp. 200 TaxID=2782665 RepID=UPI002000593D|nr:hypothetical protein [Bradyrhizobium sp. 200]UPJ49900.1 hypothetical protein IVB30_00205 [Bradyrhizobium sp. 200]